MSKPAPRDAAARRPLTLAERLIDGIRSGVYPPGTWLRQEALAEAFSVSRTPVREALRQLEAQGLVRLVPNHGALVRAPEPREVREAYQVRAELEGLAAELAAQWMTDEQLAELRQAQRDFAAAVDASVLPIKSRRKMATWVEANDHFHRVIIESSGNRRLAAIVDHLHIGFIRSVMLSTAGINGRYMRENVAQHEAILVALTRHDGVAARAAMVQHVTRSGEQMVRWLELREAAPHED